MSDDGKFGIIICALIAAMVAIGIASVAESRRNCARMFSLAQTRRDTLDVLTRSNVRGGDNCKLP
jgi:hypothetical protein